MTSVGRKAAKAVVRIVSSTAMQAVGIDATHDFSIGSCIVVAPHPDDETLGCGATIARMRSAGVDVYVVFVTGGDASPAPPGVSAAQMVTLRRDEARQALAGLGVDETRIVELDFADGELDARVDDVTAALGQVFAAVEPARVLVTSLDDRHPDHCAAARATRAAAVRCARPPAVYEYPIWQRFPARTVARDAVRLVRGGRRSRSAWGARRPALVRTAGFLDAKRGAIAAYQSQLPYLPVGFVEDFLTAHESFVRVD